MCFLDKCAPNQGSEHGADCPCCEHKGEVPWTLAQWHDIGIDDLRLANNPTTANTLEDPACEKCGEAMSDSADNRSDSKEGEGD